MKKTILPICIIFLICFMSNCFSQERVGDFPEYKEMRNYIYKERNSNFTHSKTVYKTQEQKNGSKKIYIEDKADAIYFALLIVDNLKTQYLSQDLFSSIVDAITKFPEASGEEPYAKIYLSDNLQIDVIITFTKNDNNIITIDIFDSDEEPQKKSLIIELQKYMENNDQAFFKCYYDISDFSNQTKVDPRFIRGTWYALWSYSKLLSNPNFILEDGIEKNTYDEITKIMSDVPWENFCRTSDSVDLLRSYYEKNYGQLSTLDTMFLIEIVSRILIAPM